jgi:hypothetical protein
MLIDTHVHVGQFCELYFAPSAISRLMAQVGVDYYAVSSTTMCEEDYPKVVEEIQTLIELDGSKVLPVMWITPEGLKGNIAWFLESDIKWRCLKVHPFLHPYDWLPDGERFQDVLDIARELRLPLLIHTGDDASCRCGKYESLVSHNCDITFILAHGRPLNQVIPLLRDDPNAYADSAFMPVADMMLLIQEGLAHKLLWGTDMCIPKHFRPNEDMKAYYQRKLDAFKEECTNEQYDQVTSLNAIKLFGPFS